MERLHRGPIGLKAHQVERQAYVTTVCRGVCLVLYEIFVKTVIARIFQYLGDALPFLVEPVHREAVADAKHATFAVIWRGARIISKDGFDTLVLDIIINLADKIRIAKMQYVDGFKLLAADLCSQIDASVHESHISQGRPQVVDRPRRLLRVIQHGSLPGAPKRSVYPFGAVIASQRVCAKRNLEEREPFRIGVLPYIWSQRRYVNTLVIAFDLHAFQQIAIVRYEP